MARATTEPQEMRFAACRSLSHEWHHDRQPIGSDDYETLRERGLPNAPFGGSFGMVGFVSTCTICKTVRMRWISRSGETHMRYEHPDGYARHGENKLTPTEWRQAFVASIFDTFAPRAVNA